MVKMVAITSIALGEMIDLLEQGFHCAYEKECADCYTVLLTNDNDSTEEKDIIDRHFDFEYVEVEEH